MPESRVFVAGHRGMVGSAIVRNLRSRGLNDRRLLIRTREELDLVDERAVNRFFEAERPDHVYLAAARVGGIHANNTYPAEFIRENLALQTNVINAAQKYGTSRLLFLGSSCIYPKAAPQPMAEDALLAGPLEPTNRPYAIAKIAGIEMCWAYNRQFASQFLAVMPTNLYGRGDNYHHDNSHVIPGLLRRFHDAKVAGAPSVSIWGSGNPRREFMFADDLADACVFLLTLPDAEYRPLLAANRNDGLPPVVNVGTGTDITIRELSHLISRTVGFEGTVEADISRPDGTMRKLLDSSRLKSLGWRATTPLATGLVAAYKDFLASERL